MAILIFFYLYLIQKNSIICTVCTIIWADKVYLERKREAYLKWWKQVLLNSHSPLGFPGSYSAGGPGTGIIPPFYQGDKQLCYSCLFFYILTENVILLQVLIYCVWWINDFTFNKYSWLSSFFKWVHIFFYHKTEDWLWKTFLILTADQSKWNFMVICCICFWIFFYFELGIANVANLWMFFWITHDILTFFWKYVL